jgi:hypothetical protein
MMRVPELKLFSAKHGLVMTSVSGHFGAHPRHFQCFSSAPFISFHFISACASLSLSSSNPSLGTGRSESDFQISSQIHDLILYRQEIGK